MKFTYTTRSILEAVIHIEDHCNIVSGMEELSRLLFVLEYDKTQDSHEEISGVLQGCLDDLDLIECCSNDQSITLTPQEDEIVGGVVSRLKILLHDNGVTIED